MNYDRRLRHNRPIPESSKRFSFSRFAANIARGSGRASSFLVAALICILWLVTGPSMGWSDRWQLVISTISSVITFLMVFVIQGSQTRDTDILNAKLNEIIRSLPDARREFLAIDDLHETELHRVNEEFMRLGRESEATGSTDEVPCADGGGLKW